MVVHSSIPRDVWLYIFSWLNPEELAACSQVCKIWKEYAHAEQLWKTHCAKKKIVRPIFQSWRQTYFTLRHFTGELSLIYQGTIQATRAKIHGDQIISYNENKEEIYIQNWVFQRKLPSIPLRENPGKFVGISKNRILWVDRRDGAETFQITKCEYAQAKTSRFYPRMCTSYHCFDDRIALSCVNKEECTYVYYEDIDLHESSYGAIKSFSKEDLDYLMIPYKNKRILFYQKRQQNNSSVFKMWDDNKKEFSTTMREYCIEGVTFEENFLLFSKRMGCISVWNLNTWEKCSEFALPALVPDWIHLKFDSKRSVFYIFGRAEFFVANLAGQLIYESGINYTKLHDVRLDAFQIVGNKVIFFDQNYPAGREDCKLKLFPYAVCEFTNSN